LLAAGGLHCRYLAENQIEFEGRAFVEDTVELPPLMDEGFCLGVGAD